MTSLTIQTKLMSYYYVSNFFQFSIADSFVNSQEWTLSRGVPDIRLGIVGSLSSGKSALVHRYLTGSYMQEESPEGGRFKKEVVVDGQSYLLLIRDEGGPPELQVSFVVLRRVVMPIQHGAVTSFVPPFLVLNWMMEDVSHQKPIKFSSQTYLVASEENVLKALA